MLRKNSLFIFSAESFGWLLYFLLASYSAINIAGEKYGSPDDLSISLMQSNPEGLLEAARQTAIIQGRIHQIIFFTLNNLALNEAVPFLTQGIKFASVVLIFILFSYLISKIYNSLTSLLASLILASTVVTTGEYNAINSFPLWFTLGIICFLISLILFEKLLHQHSYRNLILFSVNFFIALISSEVFFLLLLTYPLLQIKIQGKESWFLKLKSAKKIYLPTVLIAVVYFLSYITFKLSTRGTYEGASLTLNQPLKSMASTVMLSLGQANIYAMKRQIIEGGINFHFFIAVLFILIFMVILRVLQKNQSKNIIIKFSEIAIIAALALMGNLILGFTIKYSIIGLTYPLYLNSLISYLFIVLSISLFILKFSHINWVKLSTVLAVSVFGYISILDQSSQYSQLRINQNVFKVMECIQKDPAVSSILNPEIVSSDVAELSKAYDYNYFGQRLSGFLEKEYVFHRNLIKSIEDEPYSKMSVSLKESFAFGRITNFDQKKVSLDLSFRLFYDACRFEISYLTAN